MEKRQTNRHQRDTHLDVILSDEADVHHPPGLHTCHGDGMTGQEVTDTTTTEEFLEGRDDHQDYNRWVGG